MFQEFALKKTVTPQPLLAWYGESGFFGPARERARDVLARAATTIPAVGTVVMTPQGGPWHLEGSTVGDHLARMLTALFAVETGETLLHIEEFAREKDLALDIKAVETTLRTHTRLLMAFVLAHDLAKAETVFFDAAPDSKGAGEGFRQHDKRAAMIATALEQQRYEKLYRAFAVHRSEEPPEETMQAFFDDYGISTHYYDHDSRGASPEFAEAREAVAKFCSVSSAEVKLLTELIRHHIQVLTFFNRGVNREHYAVVAAWAGKAGLNVELYLDLTLAEVFLDAVAGSVQAGPSAQTSLVVDILRSEQEAMPRRHEERLLAAERAKKQRRKDLLAKAGLEGDEVFALLGTPIGPERGTVMRRILEAVDDPSVVLDFGPHTEEMVRRVAAARALLALLTE